LTKKANPNGELAFFLGGKCMKKLLDLLKMQNACQNGHI